MRLRRSSLHKRQTRRARRVSIIEDVLCAAEGHTYRSKYSPRFGGRYSVCSRCAEFAPEHAGRGYWAWAIDIGVDVLPWLAPVVFFVGTAWALQYLLLWLEWPNWTRTIVVLMSTIGLIHHIVRKAWGMMRF